MWQGEVAGNVREGALHCVTGWGSGEAFVARSVGVRIGRVVEES